MPGSKPGERRGGRQKGTPNKVNGDLRGLILLELGHDPIKALIEIAQHPKASLELRCKANTELAGYVYAKRRAVEHTGKDGAPIKHDMEIRVVKIGEKT